MFQYKCLNNILYLNCTLFKIGLSDTPLCSFCQTDNETTSHLFFSCHVSEKVWSDLRNFLCPKLLIPPLDLQSAVIGFLELPDNNIFINNILLMYKITLYRNRANNTVTARNVLLNLINREKLKNLLPQVTIKLIFIFKNGIF